MRLIDVHTLKLHTFYEPNIPPYAILSHTWLRDDEEVTFAQMQLLEKCRSMRGFGKIEFLCEQTAKDNYQFAWMDTCCIDKTNSSELSEAINSMFRWYSNAEVCYVYLEDGVSLFENRWWTRAWTLQELLAPEKVQFYDKERRQIGTKTNLTAEISAKTGIDEITLFHPTTMRHRCLARRMSWAAGRQATRVEDVAYSLLGIFRIYMPMQYGEGPEAFIRLQKEIMKSTNDPSLLAWGFTARTVEEVKPPASESYHVAIRRQYANSPNDFAECRNLTFHPQYAGDFNAEEVKGAIRMKMRFIEGLLTDVPRRFMGPVGDNILGLLPCSIADKPHCLIGVLLSNWNNEHTYRNRYVCSSVVSSLGGPGFHAFLVCSTDMIYTRYSNDFWIDEDSIVSLFSYSKMTHRGSLWSIVINLNYRASELEEDHLDGVLVGPDFREDDGQKWIWREDRSTLEYQDHIPDDSEVISVALKFTEFQLLLRLKLHRMQRFSIAMDKYPNGYDWKHHIQRNEFVDETSSIKGGQITDGGLRVDLMTSTCFNQVISELKFTPVEDI